MIKVNAGYHVTVEAIHRGVPPHVCAMGCPEYLSADICATCYRRPIKEIDRSDYPVDEAVRRGLITRQQATLMITGMEAKWEGT